MVLMKKTNAIKRLSKKIKSKRGATLVELIATVAILSIVASLSLQAIFIAAEQSRRVSDISECQRAVSLMQEQISTYSRNATRIDMVTQNVSSLEDINTAISKYVSDRNAASDHFHDDEVTGAGLTADKDADYILYWSGEGATSDSTGFHITLAKFDKDATGTNKFKTVITVDNIKEVNFLLRGLKSTSKTGESPAYVLDYTLISPTSFEIIDQTVDASGNSDNEGSYSVFSGVVLNNIDSYTSPTLGNSFKISRPEELSDGSKDYSFIVLRTVKVAK